MDSFLWKVVSRLSRETEYPTFCRCFIYAFTLQNPGDKSLVPNSIYISCCFIAYSSWLWLFSFMLLRSLRSISLLSGVHIRASNYICTWKWDRSLAWSVEGLVLDKLTVFVLQKLLPRSFDDLCLFAELRISHDEIFHSGRYISFFHFFVRNKLSIRLTYSLSV